MKLIKFIREEWDYIFVEYIVPAIVAAIVAVIVAVLTISRIA